MSKLNRPSPKSNKRSDNPRVVMVKTIKARMLGGMDRDIFQAQLINVSKTGAQFYSNKFVETNGGVVLDLDSLDGSHSVAFEGRIVWARKNPLKAMGRYAYGVNFEKMTGDLVKFLENNYSLAPAAE
ncbi:MAG TPA: PilZ domain-containing protein [bacterium]|nr:PilZ domain-containing protein [bacterium]